MGFHLAARVRRASLRPGNYGLSLKSSISAADGDIGAGGVPASQQDL